MILLDTNIISEMMKSSPDVNVINWIDRQNVLELHISSISIAEISYGINILSDGKKRIRLEQSFSQLLTLVFCSRILSFNENSAKIFGPLMDNRKILGRPMSIADGQIASIAKQKDAILATRNVLDFDYCEIEIINPFIPFTL